MTFKFVDSDAAARPDHHDDQPAAGGPARIRMLRPRLGPRPGLERDAASADTDDEAKDPSH